MTVATGTSATAAVLFGPLADPAEAQPLATEQDHCVMGLPARGGTEPPPGLTRRLLGLGGRAAARAAA